jgi:glutamate synthase domain-containing protein 1
MVERMEHRGSSTDGVSGDGAGIHLRIPHGLFASELKEHSNVVLPEVRFHLLHAISVVVSIVAMTAR